MKQTLSLALASLALAGSAYSQTWGSTGNVTVALTLSWEAFALQAKDEVGKVIPAGEEGSGPTDTNTYSVETLGGPVGEKVAIKTVNTTENGTKISTMKFGNVDILKILAQDPAWPKIGKAPFIAGWTIVAVYDQQGMVSSYEARHATKVLVNIPDFMISPGDLTITALTEKTVDTEFNPLTGEPPPPTSVHTYSDTYKSTGSASVPFYDAEMLEVSGLLTGSTKLVFKTQGTGENKVTEEVLVPGAVKLDKILGISTLDDVVEGSIGVSAGAVIDLDTLFPQS